MEGGQKVITIICTGNTCRSPMAERLLQHALEGEGAPWNQYRVISAGVAAFPGDAPSKNAVAALQRVNLDLSDHRSRRLSDQLVEISDLILTMTSNHIDILHMQYPELQIPVYRFREWMPPGSRDASDPVGGPLQNYLDTRDSLAEAVPSILSFLKNNLEK